MATQTFASASAAASPVPTSLAGGDPGTAPPLPAAQLGRVLAGMIDEGHGIEAICLFLQLTRETLLDLVVEHDLPTPHGRPRRRGGARAWTGGNYAVFIGCWLASWRAGSIAEYLGRSPGSIWSQARRLGLPRRDRASLVRPAESDACRIARPVLHPALQEWAPPVPAAPGRPARSTVAPVPPPVATPAVAAPGARPVASPSIVGSVGTAAPATEAVLRPRAWLVRNAVTPVWVRLKPRCDDIDWDQALDDEVANRCWAYQHPVAAAADFGISLRAFTSRHSRLELPARERVRLVEHYDPSAIAANIAEHGFVKRQCLALKGWWFWGPRSRGASYSKRSKRVRECVEARRYAGAVASIALPGGFSAFAY